MMVSHPIDSAVQCDFPNLLKVKLLPIYINTHICETPFSPVLSILRDRDFRPAVLNEQAQESDRGVSTLFV